MLIVSIDIRATFSAASSRAACLCCAPTLKHSSQFGKKLSSLISATTAARLEPSLPLQARHAATDAVGRAKNRASQSRERNQAARVGLRVATRLASVARQRLNEA